MSLLQENNNNKSLKNYCLTNLLVPISFPYVDASQVGYDVRPQLLVCGELKHKNGFHKKQNKLYD